MLIPVCGIPILQQTQWSFKNLLPPWLVADWSFTFIGIDYFDINAQKFRNSHHLQVTAGKLFIPARIFSENSCNDLRQIVTLNSFWSVGPTRLFMDDGTFTFVAHTKIQGYYLGDKNASALTTELSVTDISVVSQHVLHLQRPFYHHQKAESTPLGNCAKRSARSP